MRNSRSAFLWPDGRRTLDGVRGNLDEMIEFVAETLEHYPRDRVVPMSKEQLKGGLCSRISSPGRM